MISCKTREAAIAVLDCAPMEVHARESLRMLEDEGFVLTHPDIVEDAPQPAVPDAPEA